MNLIIPSSVRHIKFCSPRMTITDSELQKLKNEIECKLCVENFPLIGLWKSSRVYNFGVDWNSMSYLDI